MLIFRDRHIATAAEVAEVFLRRIILPSRVFSHVGGIVSDAPEQDLWRIYMMQLEIGNSATTDKQHVVVNFEIVATPQLSVSLMRMHSDILAYDHRAAYLVPAGVVCSGCAWMIRKGGLAADDEVRLKVAYEPVKKVVIHGV